MTATLTSKGQITIPVEVRRHLRLMPGDTLDFDLAAPYLKAHKAIDREKARTVLGSAKKGLPNHTTDEWLSHTRGRKVTLRP